MIRESPGFSRGECQDPRVYVNNVVDLMGSLRGKFGNTIELMTDIHERIDPADAAWVLKQLEPVNMFFVEDSHAPEQGEWLRHVRGQCVTPIALGELFVNSTEWLPLVKDRLIDFIRVHPSMIGGITATKRCAAVCEAFGVRTAFHGPLDMSPVGHVAQLHMDLAVPNFGIQEFYGIPERTAEVFPGTPICREGKLLLANDKPGLGIEIDEKLAAKYPPVSGPTGWTEMRLPDGSVHTP